SPPSSPLFPYTTLFRSLGSPEPRAGPPRDRRPGALVATGRSGAPRAARTGRLVRRRRTRGGRQRPVVDGVRLLPRGRVSAGPSGGGGRGRFAALPARRPARHRERRQRCQAAVP